MYKTFETYWKYVKKDGDVFIFDKCKKPPFVLERSKRIDFDTVEHQFYLNGEGEPTTLISRCGYDRGPKLRGIIKRMLKVE